MGKAITQCVLDSCMWIAAVSSAHENEGTGEEIRKAITAVLERVDEDEVVLIVPTIVIAEVNRLKPREEERFERVLHGNSVLIASLDASTARESGSIAREAREKQAKLATIDAIIVATAIRHKVTHLFTTDNKLIQACKKLDCAKEIEVGPPAFDVQGELF